MRNWQVGNTYQLLVTVEQLSLDPPSPGGIGDSKNWTGRFRIKGVKAVGADDGTMDVESAKTKALKRASTKY